MLFLDADAAEDGTDRRNSTFGNAHIRLRLFTGRDDPADRDEQFEQLYICLLDANRFSPSYDLYRVGHPEQPTTWEAAFDHVVTTLAERNFDFYEEAGGRLRRLT